MEGYSKVAAIRKFNRFYTNILGLLDQHILKSEFSLSAVRVLHEIETIANCTSKRLSSMLCMDPGYLSRILKQIEEFGFIERKASPEDGRSYFLHLTERGKKVIAGLNARSDEQIVKLIESLSEPEQRKLVQSMSAIEDLLSTEKRINAEDITIRNKLMHGDIGSLIYIHGWIYAKECQYPLAFEAYVAQTFYEFMKTYDADKDRIWLAEHNGEIIGAIGIVGHPDKAQLRWFLLHPDYRGIGLGKRLFNEALDYCREKRFSKVFLITTEDQKQAIAIYEKAGFVKVAEKENNDWVDSLMEYSFELDLTK